MKIHLFIAALLALLVGPSAATAQFGVAGRVGTLGIGAEGAIGFSERFVIRGGVGLSRLEANTSFDGVPVTLTLPESWYNVGIDFYLNGSFRIGGGVLFKPDDPTITGSFTEPVDIGGMVLTPSEIGTLTGSVQSDDQAAYALIGFGRHTAGGIGLSLDIGAAILGSPVVVLDGEGGTLPPVLLDSLLEQEAQDFAEDMKTYLKIWPILNLGIRIGVG
jgi:hypothetical protein